MGPEELRTMRRLPPGPVLHSMGTTFPARGHLGHREDGVASPGRRRPSLFNSPFSGRIDHLNLQFYTKAAAALALHVGADVCAAECQRALSQAMSRELGVEYRKNIGGLFDLVDGRRLEATARGARLAAHHDDLGNARLSDRNPATRVRDIFEELGPIWGEVQSMWGERRSRC